MLENAPNNDLATGNLGELSSGGITSIPSGMNTTVIEPAAAPGFVDYDSFNIHMVCAGGGFTYEQATGDMKGVNFSSARIRIIDVRREIEQLQWLTIIPTLCDRVCSAFVQLAELAGKAPGPGGRFTYTVEHSTPRWEYTSPTDEVSATLDEIGGGLTSFSESIRRRNDDPMVRSQELADDINRFKSLGIWEDMLALRGQARPPAAAQPAAPAAPRADEPATLNLGAICGRLGFTVSAQFVADTLGVQPARTEKASKLYTETQFAVICHQLRSHVAAMAELYAGEPA
jgi:hypothetical protein